jgi:hypothetical protein
MISEREARHRQAEKQRQADDRRLARQIDEFGRHVRMIHDAVLLSSGYHQGKRVWRMEKTVIDIGPDALTEEQFAELDRLDFIDIVQRVDKESPAREDIGALKKCFDAVPAVVSEVFGLGSIVRAQLLDKTMNLRSGQLAIHAEIDHIRMQLGYAQADGLEQLLIEQLITSWLRLQYVEMQRSSRHVGIL